MNRRDFLLTTAASVASLTTPLFAPAKSNTLLTRLVPSSNEPIPVIGMGTWITFDVRFNSSSVQQRSEVLRHFFASGGGMIDSSPMYGSSEAVVGKCLQQLNHPDKLFSATKVWTPGRRLGIRQMHNSEKLWGLQSFDLMQIHNLVDWKTHIKTLREWKDTERIRYIGVTTSHGRRHEELIKIMQSEPIDFVQFTYNIVDREAEEKLLPIATEQGIAVIINRPFRRGQLFDLVQNQPLPIWAKEFHCTNWAQYFLKYIISHPFVTVAIPATSRVEHMDENMGAMQGSLPNASMRKQMQVYYESIN